MLKLKRDYNREHLCQDLTAGKTKQTYFNRKGVYVYVNAPSVHFVHYEMRDLIWPKEFLDLKEAVTICFALIR